MRLCLVVALLAASTACAGGPPPRSTASVTAPPADTGYVEGLDGIRLYYRVLGGSQRDTLVVLHGGPGFTLSYLADDLAPLAARHTLIFYDQRGAGRSSLVRDSLFLHAGRFVDDLEAVRVHFGLTYLALLGHSWGAAVAALYGAHFPERVDRLILVGAIPPWRAGLLGAFQRMEARRDSATRQRVQELRAARLANPDDAAACRAYYALWFQAAFADPSALARSRGDFCAGEPASLANKVRHVDRYTMASLGDWDWRQTLGTVRSPALIIHGTEDFISLESSRTWATSLPQARMLLLEGAGHFPYLERPEQFFAAVDEFMRGRWPAGSQ
jgi:proline iminopeptidase